MVKAVKPEMHSSKRFQLFEAKARAEYNHYSASVQRGRKSATSRVVLCLQAFKKAVQCLFVTFLNLVSYFAGISAVPLIGITLQLMLVSNSYVRRNGSLVRAYNRVCG